MSFFVSIGDNNEKYLKNQTNICQKLSLEEKNIETQVNPNNAIEIMQML